MMAAGVVLAENYLLNMVVSSGIGQFLAITEPSSRHLIETMAGSASHVCADGDA